MFNNKKKLSAEDFYYFSLPMTSSAANLKAVRFCLWLALGQIIVLPVYFFSQDSQVLPVTGPLMLIYLLFAIISIISLITLLLFKTLIYESMVYLITSLFFLELSFLFVIVAYVEFFNGHNEMEVFNTLNIEFIEQNKIILINQLLLIPIISFICGLAFHFYMIKTGKASKRYKKAGKFKKNNSNYEKFIPIFFPVILMFTFLNSNLGIFQGDLIIILFILGSITSSFFSPVFMIISYMKLKFPIEYSERPIRTKRRDARHENI